MPGVHRLAVLFCVSLGFFATSFAQGDLSQASGLPTRIGGSRCDGGRPGAVATIQGSFNVSGLQNPEKPPKFSIALFAGGIFMSRQRIKNGGTFYFYCVPDQGAMLVAEVDASEVGVFSIGSLAPPPQTNYQDINISWSAAGEVIKRHNEVISARSAYERTAANQKSFEKAMESFREKNGDVTRKLLEELLKQDPNDFVAWTALGNIQFNQDRFEDAIVSYDRALSLKPDFVNALFGGGRANLSVKKLNRSIELLTGALSQSPDSADINHYLGEAHLQNKKGSLAVVYMRRALELAPDAKADLHLRLGWLYNAAGAKNLAADEYKQLLQKKPDHALKAQLSKYIAENSK
jgi:predicted Zn-dependent protease